MHAIRTSNIIEYHAFSENLYQFFTFFISTNMSYINKKWFHMANDILWTKVITRRCVYMGLLCYDSIKEHITRMYTHGGLSCRHPIYGTFNKAAILFSHWIVTSTFHHGTHCKSCVDLRTFAIKPANLCTESQFESRRFFQGAFIITEKFSE